MNLDSLNNVIPNDRMKVVEVADGIGSISVGSILLLLLIAGILVASFYLIKKYVLPYLRRSALKRAKVFVFRIEVLLWSLFALFSIYTFLSGSLLITLAVVALLGIAGFYFFRNFFIGLLFRLEHKFEVGDPVRFEDYLGTIEDIGVSSIQMKTDEEELVFLSYLNLHKSSLIKRQAKGRLMSQRISLPLGQEDQLQFSERIKKCILECPWAIVNERIVVNVVEDKASVTVYAVDLESLEKIEEFLLKRLFQSE